MFVALELAEFADDAVELVLAHRVPFFFPFPYGNDGTAFCVHQAQKPPSQRVSAAAGSAFVSGSGAGCCDGLLHRRRRRYRREAACVAKVCADGAEQHVNPSNTALTAQCILHEQPWFEVELWVNCARAVRLLYSWMPFYTLYVSY